MLRGSDEADGEASPVADDAELIPLIPFSAAAGTLGGEVGAVTAAQCEMLPVTPCIPRHDAYIEVHGDSMMPDFYPGSRLALRRVSDASYIQWGHPHIVVTRDEPLLKNIYDEGDAIRCVSENPRYSDFLVPKEDVLSLHRVIAVIRVIG